jgi:3-hydroxymyristoyl/3-hydroxydecanoyl-(acyl carrier protein) dehydratase
MLELEKILPQKFPMILLSRVVEYDLAERILKAEVDISDRKSVV